MRLNFNGRHWAIAVAIFIVMTSMTCKRAFVLSYLLRQDKLLKEIIMQDSLYEVQVRYTRILRSDDDSVEFVTHDYNVNGHRYFYPASMVKMPVAILALQKIRALAKEKQQPLSIYTPMYNEAFRPPQSDGMLDPLSGKVPTIAQYVDEIFSISDNNAYNRLFELLGQSYINESMYNIGAFTNSRILHRVGVTGYSPEDHQYVNAVSFKDKHGEILYHQPARQSKFDKELALIGELKGKGYINDNDSLIKQPFDFSRKNHFTIEDMEACMKRVFFSETFPEEQRFRLEKEDYDFLKRSMSLLPRNVSYLKDDPHFYDTYVKFFYDGDSTAVIPDHVKIYNKVGWAYGFLSDCSYYVDEKSGIEFLLTATIKVNKDEIYNDGVYEYTTIGLPFFRALGRKVLDYEKKLKSMK